MRVGLVVEGSHSYHQRTKADLLKQLWAKDLAEVVPYAPPDSVFGISKGNIAAMRLRRVALRKTTSIAEPLDVLLERQRKHHKIDAFIVVWDLVPPWDKNVQACRWLETLALYEGLSLSTELDPAFRTFAAQRFEEMRARPTPGARRSPPRIQRGAIVAACVEPLFESLFMSEHAMRQCLGLHGKRTRDWPSGWNIRNQNACAVIDDAIEAARDVAPDAPAFRRIRQGYMTHKTEWGSFFVRSGAFNQHLKTHPLALRLAEIS